MVEPGSLREREQTIAPPRLLALFAILGIAFDVAVNGQWPGASIPVFVACTAIALRPVLRRGPADDVLLCFAVLLGVFPALRATPDLVAMDVLAIMGLFGLVAARTGSSVFRATLESLIRRAMHLAGSALRVPAALLVPLARAAGRVEVGRARRVLRAVLIAAPILAIFTALLASADRVFGELLLPGFPDVDLGGVAGHVALTLVGVLGAATLWRASLEPASAGPSEERMLGPSVGFAEWATLLAGIDVLFAVFVGVQFAVLFGGQARVEVTAGLTYAEYARSGFFQLIIVAALTAIVILGGWDLGRRAGRREERTFRALVSAMVAFSGVILASAFTRLALYEGTFGFTVPRLAAYVAICWIGFVLFALLIAIWTGARDRVIAAAIAGGLIALLAVNVLNPERFVAERNVARFEAIGKIDAAYLGYDLGLEAVPAAVAILPALDEARAIELRDALCETRAELRHRPRGWRSANLGRARAADALARLECPIP